MQPPLPFREKKPFTKQTMGIDLKAIMDEIKEMGNYIQTLEAAITQLREENTKLHEDISAARRRNAELRLEIDDRYPPFLRWILSLFEKKRRD
jgi:predicted  nucleic acid-binding Zn-ribbon protein